MANSNTPFGFRPISQPNGTVVTHLYKADTTDNIFKYDPVVLTSDGRVTCALTGDLQPLLGVAMGFIDKNRAGFGDNLETDPYLKQDKDAFVIVADDVNQRFLVQADTGGTNLAETDIGNCCTFNWLQGESGNTVTGVSMAELDQSDIAADTGGSFQLVDYYDAVDNTTGNWAKWVVKISRHQLGPNCFSVPI
jgi:hypothetical protein